MISDVSVGSSFGFSFGEHLCIALRWPHSGSWFCTSIGGIQAGQAIGWTKSFEAKVAKLFEALDRACEPCDRKSLAVRCPLKFSFDWQKGGLSRSETSEEMQNKEAERSAQHAMARSSMHNGRATLPTVFPAHFARSWLLRSFLGAPTLIAASFKHVQLVSNTMPLVSPPRRSQPRHVPH
jgi:hypothetical protein